MIESDASSSTKTSFDLLDEFFLPIQWRGSEVGRKSSTVATTMAVNRALDIRVSQRPNAKRQKQGKKERRRRRALK
jgi:hypothetical protein